jgi:hypothetical protein
VIIGDWVGLNCSFTDGETGEQETRNITQKSIESLFINSNSKVTAQRQVLPARAGIGRKKPKGEPAKGAESLEVRALPALVRCTRCWAFFCQRITLFF